MNTRHDAAQVAAQMAYGIAKLMTLKYKEICKSIGYPVGQLASDHRAAMKRQFTKTAE